MFESMEMDWLCLESAIMNFEVENKIDISNQYDYDETENDLNIEPANEVTLLELAILGTMVVPTGVALGKSAARKIKYKNEVVNAKELTDSQLKEFESAVNVAKNLLRKSPEVIIEDCLPAIAANSDKIVNNWKQSMIIKENDRERMKYTGFCPIFQFTGGTLSSSTNKYVRRMDKAFAKRINEEFKERNLPCQAIVTQFDRCDIAIKYLPAYSKGSTAKESIAFGADLFQQSIALEATETSTSNSSPSFGSALWKTITSIFGAIKKFFIKLLEKITHIMFVNEDKSIKMTYLNGQKFVDEANTVYRLLIKAINILVDNVNANKDNSARMCAILNHTFDGVNDVKGIRCTQEFLDNAKDISESCKHSVEIAQDAANEVKSAFKKSREKCLQLVDISSKDDPDKVYGAFKRTIMNQFHSDADISIRSLQRCVDNVKYICNQNIHFCERMIKTCKGQKSGSSDDGLKDGYRLCKYYMDISRSWQSFGQMVASYNNGSYLVCHD